MHPDFFFKRSSLYEQHQHCINVLHGYSYRVIRERKAEIANNNNNNNNNSEYENKNITDSDLSKFEVIDHPKKKRLAFLDLLIEASQDGSVLSEDDIREEVDTFMFEVKILLFLKVH